MYSLSKFSALCTEIRQQALIESRDLYYMRAHGLMTTNLKWSFFLMTLSGTLIPIFKKISYAPTGSLGHSSETKVNMEFVFTFNEIG